MRDFAVKQVVATVKHVALTQNHDAHSNRRQGPLKFPSALVDSIEEDYAATRERSSAR
jgi:hypothetical protein